jgi:hypothetical protein
MARSGLKFTLRQMMIVIVIAGVVSGLAVHVRNTFRDEELYAEDILYAEAILLGIGCVIIFVISCVIGQKLKDDRYAASLRFRLSPPEVPIPENGELCDGVEGN